MNQLNKSLENVINQVIHLVNLVSEKDYCELEIGKHIRHVNDHILAFVSAYSGNDILDYNFRRREHPIENSKHLAIEECNQNLRWLIETDVLSKSMQIVSEYDCESTHSASFESNTNRELLYIINHTIHHLALMRLKLEQADYKVVESIGLAPATVTYRRELTNAV